MKFRKTKGWKYQLTEPYQCQIRPFYAGDIETEFVQLDRTGALHLKRYYAWDGASGPCPDVKSIMIASLVHDALYQLMRQDLIDRSSRIYADRELKRFCILNGMPRFWANIVYWGVRVFAKKGVYPFKENVEYEY